MGTEIERRFLVHDAWPKGQAIAESPMLQGYMPTGRACAVRLRRNGANHYLTVKEGGGLQRRESEIKVSAKQFEALWPHTTDHRIEKTRWDVPHATGTIEVDVFEGQLAGTVIAEMEFPSVEEAWAAQLPAWCSEEITGLLQFSNSTMSRHGYPKTPSACTGGTPFSAFRLGAMPYRFCDQHIEVLLVTARSSHRWILPKGVPENDLSRAETGALEAFEEGGVEGRMDPFTCRACQLWSGQICFIYPLHVEEELPRKKWHEAGLRERQWLSLEAAVEQVSPEYAPVLTNLASILLAARLGS